MSKDGTIDWFGLGDKKNKTTEIVKDSFKIAGALVITGLTLGLLGSLWGNGE